MDRLNFRGYLGKLASKPVFRTLQKVLQRLGGDSDILVALVALNLKQPHVQQKERKLADHIPCRRLRMRLVEKRALQVRSGKRDRATSFNQGDQSARYLRYGATGFIDDESNRREALKFGSRFHVAGDCLLEKI